MTTYSGTLTNPPVREALIDIQFAPGLDQSAIKQFAELRRSSFEKLSPIWQTMFGFSIVPDGVTQEPSAQTAVGFRMENSDPAYVLQTRTQGFTFSRLPPYASWSELRSDAKEEWDVFVETAPKFTIQRIAVRYINELKIPLTLKDFSEYLTCPPEVPKGLPQGLGSFLQRVVIPDGNSRSVSIVTQALEDGVQPLDDNTIKVLLDIDVFRMVQIESTNSEMIWTELDELRAQKNKMFFGHITDKMADILK